jgi:UDP-GlcNAc:undecaprenyl-phosphate GlcNAc-1-phosphate transferase
MIVVILALIGSTLCALVGIPILANLARRFGLVDHPDDKRKLHTDSIPMVGGIAVFLTMVLIVPVAIFIGVQYQPFFISLGNDLLGWIPIDFGRRVILVHPDDFYQLPGLLIGASVLVVVGILDDRFGIRGRQKLMGQFIAATVLIIFGYHFESILIAGVKINFDAFSVFFVYAWVLAAINSVNLLDGADGVAGTIGIVMSLALSVMAIYQGMMITAIICVAMAGALLGFLRFNFPPAKVYLGDTGSMLIGFVLSALAIRCTFKQHSAYAFFAPIALLAIPFIDTGAAIIRRRLTGRSIFAVDRGHLHHTLAKRGYSPQISLLWVALLCTTTAAGGVLSLLYRQSEYALVSIVIVVIVMIGCRIFGLAEYRLISRKTSSMARSFLTMASSNAPDVQQSSVHVQGIRDWQDTWTRLCEFADAHGLVEITMDLNAPWLHESFHATRRRSDLPRGGNHDWFAQIPLISDGRLFGRVEITGSAKNDESHREIIKSMMAVTADIEYSFAESTRDSIYKLVDTVDEAADAIVNSDQNVANDKPRKLDADLDIPDSTASTTSSNALCQHLACFDLVRPD